MRRSTLITLCLVLTATLFGQVYDHELALSAAPLQFKKMPQYDILYRYQLNDKLKLRVILGAGVNTRKEIRYDSITLNTGRVRYSLAAGLQRSLYIDDLEKVQAYVAVDGYWNSMFKREDYHTYYGYYWDFGVRPLAGVQYTPWTNIRLSIESRGDLNVNLQEYTAPGDNSDQRIRFRTFDQFALNIGYLF